MRKDVRNALYELATRADRASGNMIQSQKDIIATLQNAIQKNNRDDLALTIKNYEANKGLSAWIHRDIDS